MPNIELYGFERQFSGSATGDTQSKRYVIRQLIEKNLPRILEDVVFTEHLSTRVVNTQKPVEDKPYVRVCDTNVRRAKKIARLIHGRLGLEVEVQKLEAFYGN